jgi:tetratricopeptide (TPR) repeat protein
MKPTLHGRATELDAIRSSFESVRRGSSTTFALIGEPGIGKTRLADEVTEQAKRAGFASYWGRAWEAGGAPAYFPWRSLLEAMPLGAGVRPGMLDMLSGKSVAAATDPDQARFELFDAVATTLRAASGETPLLCVLDDLHAADLPSLELAAFVTRHLRSHPILWIVTWRDVEAATGPGKDVIGAIARNAHTIALRRLSADETRRLVDELAAGGTHGHLMGRETSVDETLFRATSGNPLFILETLACVTTRGLSRLPRELDQLPLTEGVAAVVRARLSSLPPAARHAVEAASLLGRELAIDRWVDAADMPEELLRQRGKEVVASGVLVATGPSQWAFSHDLVREAISRDVPDDLARAAHRRVALALDRRVAGGERSLAGARLHHGLAALGAIDATVVLAWVIEASDDARAQCAYEQSLTIVKRAIAALGPRFANDPRLLLALGRAHLDLGEIGAARDALHSAIDMTRASGDARTRALAVLAFGSRYVLGDIHSDLVRMIDEASAALPSEDHDLRARLLARKAAALTPARRPDEVLAWARDAFRMVVDSNDEGARLDVCVGVGSAFGDFAHPRERIPVNEELVRLARTHKDRALELRGLSRLVTDHIEAGNFPRADMVLAERDELARALKQPRFGWMAPLFRSMRAMAEGGFEVCRAAVADADALGLESGDANAARCTAVHRTWLFLLQDDVHALLEHEAHVLVALRSMPTVLSSVVRASIRMRNGEQAASRQELAAIDSTLPNCAVNTMVTLAEVVADLGPPELAQTLIARLEPHADTFAIWGLFALTCGLPVATALGGLEAAFGDRERAVRHFETALERATRAGARTLRVWTRYAYGRALIQRLGDRERGRTMLEEAAEEAMTLGMSRLPARCRALIGGRSAPPPETGSTPPPSRRSTPPTGTRSAPPPETTTETGAPSRPSPVGAWTMRPEAGAWRLERAGKSLLVPALRGMPMIARLVETPDTEVHSLELVSGVPTTSGDAGDAGEHLDEHARAAYRKRAAELVESIEEAEERGDANRADAARSELDALQRELSRAVGRGGRKRRAGAAAERARISAQRRIREAIRRIHEVDPELAGYLDRTVQTGVYCVYAPRSRKRS